jgi:flagellar operon protein
MDKMNTNRLVSQASQRLGNQLSRIENLIPKAPTEIKKSDTGATTGVTAEETVAFKEVLADQQSVQKPAKDIAGLKAENLSGIKFSNHAIERMQTRGISFNPDRLQKLDEAIKKAAAKGSRDTLVLMDDSAAIVSVKNNTVVTVMDKNNLKENVFTNIDSTIVI